MPRVKHVTPQSLQERCIEFVLQNLSFWCKQSTNDLYTIHSELGSNPFDLLPGVVLEKIAYDYAATKGESYYSDLQDINILQHLITPQLINTMLPDDPETVKLASIRCSKLKTLIVDTCFHYDLNFFPKFENLESLDLSFSEADDSFLNVLGSYCTNLRELNLDNCKRVSDYGIQGLCVSVDDQGRKDVNLGRCKSIRSLILGQRTGVTKKGTRMALENLPALAILIHDSTVEALAEITYNRPYLPELTLSVLRISDEVYYQSGNLELALSLCPSISTVYIREPVGLRDSDLLSLSSLKRMKKLEIHAISKLKVKSPQFLLGDVILPNITFDGGLAPLLTVTGGLLTTLIFSCLYNVNVLDIIECCPNLEYLCLEGNYTYASSCRKIVQKSVMQKRETKQLILKNLSRLRVIIMGPFHGVNLNSSDSFIQPELLVILLSSPLLTNIRVSNCDTLNDDVLLAAGKFHNFVNLESLSLEYCHHVTNRSIRIFMQDNNALKNVDLISCKELTSEKNYHYWKNLSLTKNWDLSIFFSPMEK